MKLQLFSAAALGAVALLLGSAPAEAKQVLSYAGTLPTYTTTMKWTESASKTGGTMKTGVKDLVSVTVEGLVSPVDAYFTFVATAPTGSPAVLSGSFIDQPDLDAGSFKFASKSSFVYKGVTYGAGTDILSGTFTNAEIYGLKGATQGSLVDAKGVDFSTQLVGLTYGKSALNSFEINLPTITPGLIASGSNQALKTFSSQSDGSFSSAVPEAGSWAMMLLGLGGIGVALRAHKRADRELDALKA